MRYECQRARERQEIPVWQLGSAQIQESFSNELEKIRSH